MADLGMNFNASEHEDTSFSPLEAGDYVCIAEKSEIKESKKTPGAHYISWTFQVVGDKGKGRKLWDNMTLSHPNEEAVRIGRGMLAALVKAAGKEGIADTCELHGVPVALNVGLVKDGQTGDMVNKVKAYKSAAVTNSAPPASGDAAPWPY